jgi:hypothetical protein
VWLHSEDPYRPTDLTTFIRHTRPRRAFAELPGVPADLTLHNLDELNALGGGGREIFLTSADDVTTNPRWIEGVAPDATGRTPNAVCCVVIVADRGGGGLDAFYMYFYACVFFSPI